MTEIYDLSLTISPRMVSWPGDPEVDIAPLESTAKGADYNVSRIRIGSHTGTHVDAPHHVTETGAAVDQLPLDVLIGEAWVCHFSSAVRSIGAKELEDARIPDTVTRVLFATSNSALWSRPDAGFAGDFVAVSPEGAEWLVERGIRLVGIDYLSVGSDDGDGLSVHRALLTHGVIVLEGLDLRTLPGGPCHLCCLPLKLSGCDGAPARVVALRNW